MVMPSEKVVETNDFIVPCFSVQRKLRPLSVAFLVGVSLEGILPLHVSALFLVFSYKRGVSSHMHSSMWSAGRKNPLVRSKE